MNLRRRAVHGTTDKQLSEEALQARLDSIRAGWTDIQSKHSSELAKVASTFSDDQTIDYYVRTVELVHSYRWACQLPGQLALVVDNNIIQDFKHQLDPKQSARRVRAMAVVAFSRFVRGWSVRPTFIALSPVVIYEHCGREVPDLTRLGEKLSEIRALLEPTGLDVRPLRFETLTDLQSALRAVDHDAASLRDFAQSIHSRSWRRDLRAEVGWKIPMSIAAEELTREQVSLRYFSLDCVARVFSAVVEDQIATQSAAPGVQVIRSGEASLKMAKLTGIPKSILRGKISGLGDLELLDGCRLGAQFHRPNDVVFLAQTFDKDLRFILEDLSGFVMSRQISGGASESDVRSATEFLMTCLTGDAMPEHTARMQMV
jgi:hypothetical protein